MSPARVGWILEGSRAIDFGQTMPDTGSGDFCTGVYSYPQRQKFALGPLKNFDAKQMSAQRNSARRRSPITHALAQSCGVRSEFGSSS